MSYTWAIVDKNINIPIEINWISTALRVTFILVHQ
jgi:hypothetical protein